METDYEEIISRMRATLTKKLENRGLSNVVDSEDIIEEINDAIAAVNERRRFEATSSTPFETKYESLIVKLALASITKYGAEGETSHGENGISRNYDTAGEYPEALLSRIVPLAKAR